MKLATTLLALALIAGGCRKEANAPSSTTAPVATTAAANAALTPEQLGELGANIRKDPANADSLLARHHLTRQQFEQAIRDVTENVDTAKRYAEAFRKASA
jgi:hypothetical protein